MLSCWLYGSDALDDDLDWSDDADLLRLEYDLFNLFMPRGRRLITWVFEVLALVPSSVRRVFVECDPVVESFWIPISSELGELSV